MTESLYSSKREASSGVEIRKTDSRLRRMKIKTSRMQVWDDRKVKEKKDKNSNFFEEKS